MSNGVNGSPPVLVYLAVLLLWVAAAAALLITMVSGGLAAGMDALFEQAVVDGRAFPFSGEADDLAFPVMTMALCAGLSAGATLLVAILLGRRVRAGRSGYRAIAISVIGLAAWTGGPLLFVASWIGLKKFDLFASWYRPFLFGVGILYVGCLLAAAVLSASSAARVWTRRGQGAVPRRVS